MVCNIRKIIQNSLFFGYGSVFFSLRLVSALYIFIDWPLALGISHLVLYEKNDVSSIVGHDLWCVWQCDVSKKTSIKAWCSVFCDGCLSKTKVSTHLKNRHA